MQLIRALQEEDIVAAAVLLSQGADLRVANDNGEAALMYVSFYGHSSVVKILVDHSADMNFSNYDGTTALRAATENEHTDVVEFLLSQGALR